MQKIYTTNLLIRNLYHETTPSESARLKADCLLDAELDEERAALKKIVQELDHISFLPNPTSIQLVMEYAHNLHEPAH